jgi:hypothetical protein
MPERDSAGHEGYAGALTDKKTQTEHEYIRWRQTEGITAAKAIGLHFTKCVEAAGKLRSCLRRIQSWKFDLTICGKKARHGDNNVS